MRDSECAPSLVTGLAGSPRLWMAWGSMKVHQGGGRMTKARAGGRPGAFVAALLVLGAALAGGVHTAGADVAAVKGSAYGYSFSVSLFNGPPKTGAPTPSVTLASDASNSPQSATAPSARAAADPATFFTSGPLTVRSEGSLGPNGSVTSSVDIQNVNTSGPESLTASKLTSTCTASQSAAPTGSVTVTGGTVQTDNGDNDPANAIPDHPAVSVAVPANPAPNTVI